MGITELAETVRDALRQDELWAHDALGLLGIETPWHTPQQLMARGLTRGDAIHVSRHSARRVLAEVAGKRQLLDEALGWRHDVHDDSWFTCQAATDEHDGGTYAETDGGGPCTCGRDARVLAILTHLAQPYQETT